MGVGRGIDWATDAFGENAVELRKRIPKALGAAHIDARAAHDAGKSTKLNTYGMTLWVRQHEHLVSAVVSVSDQAKVVHLGGYELAVLAKKAFFPLRYTDRSGISVSTARLPVPVSGQRQRLLGAHAPKIEPAQPYLDDSWTDLGLPDGHEPFPQLGEGTELILIAYACNLEAGVMNVEWGLAEHLGDGELRWGDHESLPLVSAARTSAAAASRDEFGGTGQSTGTLRFDSAKEPGLPLGPRPAGHNELDVPPQTERPFDEPRVQGDEQD